MKKATLLHGTDGNPDANWFPWLNKQLKARQYEVFAPLLPENHTPNKFLYEKFLIHSGWDFTNNLLVGHSSGATTVLNLLQSDWFPKVGTVILVGTFLNEKLLSAVDWYKEGQFKNLFTEPFDAQTIKEKAEEFFFIHGSDDLYCDVNDAKQFCKLVNGTFTEVAKGKHLSSNRTELPEILPILEQVN